MASDFQRIQSGATAKKLADRNCIVTVEVIVRLKAEGLIDIVYSVDGKEFVTKDHLKRQVVNELLGSGGRIALTTLQEALSVVFQHIEDAAGQICHSDDAGVCRIVLGQLLTQDYVTRVTEKVMDWLHDAGKLSIGQISKAYDLPFEFVSQEITANIPAITDKEDSQVLYTKGHIAHQQKLLLGALAGLNTPYPMSKIVQEHNLQVGLLFQCFDELVARKEVHGVLSGGRQIDRAIYIPEIYKKAVAAWAKDSYHQNGYIEQSSLKKLGWKEPVNSLVDSSLLKSSILLNDCVVSDEIWKGLKEQLKEKLVTTGWVDVLDFLPDFLSSQSASAKLLEEAVAPNSKKGVAEFSVVDGCFVYADRVLQEILPLFEADIDEKSESVGPDLVKAIVIP